MTKIPDPFYNTIIQYLTDLCVILFIISIGLARLNIISVETYVNINVYNLGLFLFICIYDKFEQFKYSHSK